MKSSNVPLAIFSFEFSQFLYLPKWLTKEKLKNRSNIQVSIKIGNNRPELIINVFRFRVPTWRSVLVTFYIQTQVLPMCSKTIPE